MYHNTFSASSLKTYEMCPFKYHLRYDLKQKQQPSHYTCFGSIVHHILQVCARYKSRYNLHIVRDRLKKFIQDSIDDTDLFELYQKKGIHKTRDQAIEQITNMTYDIMGREGFNHPMNHKIIAAEQYFEIEIGSDSVDDKFTFIGYIDLCIKRLNDDDETIQIIDYKTGKHVLNYKTINEDIQARLYDLAASILFPGHDIIITFENIRPDKKSVTTTFHEDEREKFKVQMFDLAFKIKHDQELRLIRRPYQKQRVSYICKFLCGYFPQICDKEYKKHEKHENE